MKQLTTYIVACLWCWAMLIPLQAQGLKSFLSGGVTAAPAGEIAYVATAVNNFTGTRSPSIVLPTCSTNDIVLVVICADTTAAFNGAPPTGWTKLDDEVDATPGDASSAVYWGRVDGVNIVSGSTTAWTNVIDTTEDGISSATAFSGCKTTGSPINAQGDDISGGSASASDGPSLTPTVNNCMIVGIRTIDPGASTRTFTWDSPFTLRLGFSTTPSGLNGTTAGIYIGTYLQPTAGLISPQGDFDAAEAACRYSYALEPQ